MGRENLCQAACLVTLGPGLFCVVSHAAVILTLHVMGRCGSRWLMAAPHCPPLMALQRSVLLSRGVSTIFLCFLTKNCLWNYWKQPFLPFSLQTRCGRWLGMAKFLSGFC